MKSGLFCQKCVNKHGNTSSEGHNSILCDKCSESTVALRLSHKISEQTKVVTGCNDLISTFSFSSQPTAKLLNIKKEFVLQSSLIIVNQLGKKREREMFHFFSSKDKYSWC